MASGKVHSTVGTFSGALIAGGYGLKRDVSPTSKAAYAVGGMIGGNLTGKLADKIDPPTSPNHRSIGHGIIPAFIVGHLGYDSVIGFLRSLDTEADRFASEGNILGELACRLICGVIVGAISGHMSHLALDSATAKGLPWIV